MLYAQFASLNYVDVFQYRLHSSITLLLCSLVLFYVAFAKIHTQTR